MNALLYFPGFIIIVYFLLDESLIKSTSVLIVMIFIQIIMGWQFYYHWNCLIMMWMLEEWHRL